MATSAESVEVSAAANIAATGVPAISGVAQAGQTLTATIGDVHDENGFALGSTHFSYEWVSKEGDGKRLPNVSRAVPPTY